MEMIQSLYRDERGQTGTEYMVLLASVVAVIIGAAYVFEAKFKTGVEGMGTNVEKNLKAGFADAAAK